MKSEVFNTDCLEAMRAMPDKAFDLNTPIRGRYLSDLTLEDALQCL